MKKILLFIFLIISILYLSTGQRFYPEEYKPGDLIFPANDKIQNYEYNLIDAKVLTKEEITLYIKKQGIHLTYDDCCKNEADINVWENIMKDDSDLKEIYKNAKYIPNQKKEHINFQSKKLKTKDIKFFINYG